jgi:DNA-directed RNA polymerase subunit RPC12/RpoP
MSDDIVKALLESLTDEQKAQLVQGLLTTNENDEVLWVNPELKTEETVSPVKSVGDDFRVTNSQGQVSKGKTPVKARKNSWKDDGSFQLEGEDEWATTRKRTPRSRGKATKVEVECSVCGKTFMENPNLIYGEYHRCNRCGRR